MQSVNGFREVGRRHRKVFVPISLLKFSEQIKSWLAGDLRNRLANVTEHSVGWGKYNKESYHVAIITAIGAAADGV
jgi:hypothetical protein